MFNKIIRVVRHATKQVINNRLRFFLTLSGIIISTTILVASFITLDSYYEAQRDVYDNYLEGNIFQIKGFLYEDDIVKIEEEFDLFNSFVGIYSKNLFDNLLEDERTLDFYQVHQGVTSSLIPTFKSDNSLTEINIIEGRDIFELDIDKALVSSYYRDNFCVFLDCNDTKIRIDIYGLVQSANGNYRDITHTVVLDIVGVYEVMEDLNSEIVFVSNDNTLLTSMEDFEEEAPLFSHLILDYTDQELIDMYSLNINDFNNQLSIYEFNALNQELESELLGTTEILKLIAILISLFSALNVTNILLFSVKERITEIGLKIALGATKRDIFFQFIIESAIYSGIGIVIGSTVGVLSSYLIYIQSSLNGYDLSYTINFSSIIFAISVPFLMGLISSIVVTIYAIRIKITKALRFD